MFSVPPEYCELFQLELPERLNLMLDKNMFTRKSASAPGKWLADLLWVMLAIAVLRLL